MTPDEVRMDTEAQRQLSRWTMLRWAAPGFALASFLFYLLSWSAAARFQGCIVPTKADVYSFACLICWGLSFLFGLVKRQGILVLLTLAAPVGLVKLQTRYFPDPPTDGAAVRNLRTISTAEITYSY